MGSGGGPGLRARALALTPLCVTQAFQRQVHERLTQLELVNKQYRRLARENRTDAASRLKQMVHEGNQRWDGLQKRVTAVLRRLRVTSPRHGAVGISGRAIAIPGLSRPSGQTHGSLSRLNVPAFCSSPDLPAFGFIF